MFYGLGNLCDMFSGLSGLWIPYLVVFLVYVVGLICFGGMNDLFV